MKMKSGLFLTAVFGLLAQTASAQTIAANENKNFGPGNLQNNNQNLPRGNVLATKTPNKGLSKKIIEDTSLSYYHQFLGPTFAGRANQTYNVFQAGGGPVQDSGRAPVQSFQAVNLRHQINPNWQIGVSLAVTNGYAARVKNPNGDINTPKEQWLNSRVNLVVPSLPTKLGTLFTTLSYEIPSSVVSRREDMRFGWVIAESFAFNIPSQKWTAGVTGQVYRMVYKNNTVPTVFTSPGPLQGQVCTGCAPVSYQTLIVSGGPYVNYRYSDRWLFASLVTVDWDQQGNQTGTTHFNNNLPHRGRVTATYIPQGIKYLSSVGVFSQALLKFRPETTAVGLEFALRF